MAPREEPSAADAVDRIDQDEPAVGLRADCADAAHLSAVALVLGRAEAARTEDILEGC